MGKKKKKPLILTVDFVNAGGSAEKFDPYKDRKSDTGSVKMTKTPYAKRIEREAIVQSVIEKENELKKLKKTADRLDITPTKIGDMRDEFKEKKKKDKEKIQKRDDYLSMYGNLANAVPDDLAEYIRSGGKDGSGKKKKKKKNKDKDKKNLSGLVVKEKNKNSIKEEMKKDPNSKFKTEISERFKEVERITRENIREIDNTILVVNERVNKLTSSSERVRGMDNALAQYITAKTSLLSARQRAASDILANRTKVIDIEMKKDKDSKSTSQTDNDMLAKLLPGIMLGNQGNESVIRQYIDGSGKNKDGKKKKKKYDDKGHIRYDDDDELLDRREKELLKEGKISYTNYDKHIEYEGTFNVAIKKSWNTGDWKFIAIDEGGNFLNDVPKSMLPSKKICKMKFDDETDRAIDINSNRSFQVFQVPEI